VPSTKTPRETVSYTLLPIITASGFKYPLVVIVNLVNEPHELQRAIGKKNAWIYASGKSTSSWMTADIMGKIVQRMKVRRVHRLGTLGRHSTRTWAAMGRSSLSWTM